MPPRATELGDTAIVVVPAMRPMAPVLIESAYISPSGPSPNDVIPLPGSVAPKSVLSTVLPVRRMPLRVDTQKSE